MPRPRSLVPALAAALAILSLLAGGARAARAQGSLATQGFGYPTGQLSAGALGAGGAAAETDAASLLNPASIGTRGRYSVYFQFQPEFRRTRGSGFEDNSTTMRFPGFLGTFGWRRLTGGVSFSTLLDRSFSNTYADSQLVGGEWFPSSLRAASSGALNDSRFAASYAVNDRLQVGLGVHVLSGQNRIEFGRTFPDSTGIGSVATSSRLSYAGRTYSAGVISQPFGGLVVSASARFGGTLNSDRDEEPLDTGKPPTRYGLGLSWIGIPNTVLSARIDRTNWTEMDDLATDDLDIFDATEVGLGAELQGPRVFGTPSVVRLGFRDRGLPFGVQGEQVNERSLSGGLGLPVARGRGQVDLTLQRSARAAAGVTERSWFLGVGVGIRP
jgi:hypothetical protein